MDDLVLVDSTMGWCGFDDMEGSPITTAGGSLGECRLPAAIPTTILHPSPTDLDCLDLLRLSRANPALTVWICYRAGVKYYFPPFFTNQSFAEKQVTDLVGIPKWTQWGVLWTKGLKRAKKIYFVIVWIFANNHNVSIQAFENERTYFYETFKNLPFQRWYSCKLEWY